MTFQKSRETDRVRAAILRCLARGPCSLPELARALAVHQADGRPISLYRLRYALLTLRRRGLVHLRAPFFRGEIHLYQRTDK